MTTINKKITIFVLFLFLYVSRAHAVIILVHGSFATLSTWWKPHGPFYDELEKQAAGFKQKVISFSWSGIPQDAQIISGAEALAKTILSYPADEEIILIGHSHGGNVINFASHLLHDWLGEIFAARPYTTISSIITQAYNSMLPGLNLQNSAPVVHNLNQPQDYTITTKQHKNNPVFKTVMNAISRIENHKLTHRARNKTSNKRFMLDKVYILGTPVHTEKYPPQMKVIKNFFNLYSTGDFIQPIFGLYKRTYPLHERLVNLSVSIQDTGNFLRPNKPQHYELHSPIIAQWLLAIPETLQAQKLGNFEKFSFNKNGALFFSHKHAPFYYAIHKKKSLRIF